MKRIYHPWWLWECYPAGLYGDGPQVMSKEEGEELYAEFLGDLKRFEKGLLLVINKWKYSCEHNLSNDSLNRIAWLGQASVCIVHKVPNICRRGFSFLSDEKQREANILAWRYLNIWLVRYKQSRVSLSKGLKS